MEEAALTIATGNNNNIDENKLNKNNNNNNKFPVGGIDSKSGLTPHENLKLNVLNNLPANWFLNLNNKLVETGNLSLLAGNLRNYQHLAGKLSELNELSGKIADVSRVRSSVADVSRHSPGFPKNPSPGSACEGKSSPSSRESPVGLYESSPNGTPTEEKIDEKCSPSAIWPAWWSTRNPSPSNLLAKSSLESPARAQTQMLVRSPLRSHEDQHQPLDFSVSTKNLTKFKPKMTISQTKILINNLQNGHLNLKKTHSHSLNNNNHNINNKNNSVRHRRSFKSSSSSSAGSDDESVEPQITVGSPGPLSGETGKILFIKNIYLFFDNFCEKVFSYL